jgi:hypothetical protein
MKKLFLSVMTLVALSLSSQAQFRLGVKAGISESKQNISGNSLFSNDSYRSYEMGLIGDISLTENLYLQPQALYSRKGSTLLNSTGIADTKVRMNYINVPYSGKNWKHEDFGLSFTAGIECNNGLFVSANSQKGLLDVYKTDGVSVKNRSVSLSVGYLIDWKRLKKG